MVALATWIESEQTAPAAKNRVGDFFGPAGGRVGESVSQVVDRDWEKRSRAYDSRLGYVLAQKENEKNVPDPKTDCEKTVDFLVSNAQTAQAGYETMKNCPNRELSSRGAPMNAIAGVGLNLSWLGWSLRDSGDGINPIIGTHDRTPVSGFRNELVEHGQNSDVHKHLFATAGAGLAGGPEELGINVIMNISDLYDVHFGGRSHAAAELAGTRAGYDVGKDMRSFALGGNSNSDQLREKMLDRLCQ